MGLPKVIIVYSFLTLSLHTKLSFQQAQPPAAAYAEDPNILYPFVKSPAGQFLGQALQSRTGEWYNEFRGIPFAEAPKRFERSVLAKPLTGIYDARNHKSICAQAGGQGSEDCLFLSVAYPHEDRCQNETRPASLPVMVNIHGGGFSGGSGSSAGGKYLLDKCVVFVSINYRLGALGFLTTQDGVIPGNLGLKDQVVALKWVQSNIASFRGDPSRVTIFGISAGGSSVSHLMASPAAKGLFHGAIPQSGVALNPWSLVKYPDMNAQALAQALSCSTSSSSEMLACLKTKNANDIISKQAVNGDFVPFAPVIEGPTVQDPFQTQHPVKAFQTGNFNKVPMMAGFTKDEGIGLFAQVILGNPVYVYNINAYWNMLAPTLFYYDKWNISAAERDIISTKIRRFYFNDKPVGESTRQNLTNLYSDRIFVQGIFYSVELISKFTQTYPYVMSYKGGFSGAIGLGYMVPASTHGDDSQYLFNSYEYPFGTQQNEFSRNMVSLWASFATTGKPIGDAPTLGTWEPAAPGTSNARWFDLNVPTKTLSNYLEERRQFWKSLGSEKYDVY